MKRNIWKETFVENQKTEYPCPRCLTGHLEPVRITFYDRETSESASMRKDPDWGEDWYEGRFSGILQCDNGGCEEVVSVIGKSGFGTDWDKEGEEFNFSEYHPRGFFPAIPIISIPSWSRSMSTRLFQRSFSLFWSDPLQCRKILLSLFEIQLKLSGISRRNYRSRQIQSFKARLKKSAYTSEVQSILLTNYSRHILGIHPSRDELLDLFEIIENTTV